MELAAYNLTKYKLSDYYLTYPGTLVQSEAVGTKGNYIEGPRIFSLSNFLRDNPRSNCFSFVVEDRNYISARWPGDENTFIKKFEKHLLLNSNDT